MACDSFAAKQVLRRFAVKTKTCQKGSALLNNQTQLYILDIMSLLGCAFPRWVGCWVMWAKATQQGT